MFFKLKDLSKQTIWLKPFTWLWVLGLAFAAYKLLPLISWEWFSSINSAFILNNPLLVFISMVVLYVAAWLSIFAINNKKITERNRIKEAFSTAIQQLRSNRLGVANTDDRLTAIYALEILAKDHKELYQTVIDVLVNYVRENAPMPPHFEKKPSDTTRVDVQAAMTVLGRRHVTYSEQGLNLHRVYLPKINLKYANLQNADLMGADLCGADLSQAKLQGASLFNVNLLDTNLVGANIKGSDFTATRGLSCDQLKMARKWKSTYRDQELSNGAEIPDFLEKYGPIADTI